MVDFAGRLDQLLRPRDRLVDSEPHPAHESRIRSDDGGGVEVAVVSGAPEAGAQIGQFDGEPFVRLTLSGAVPQGQESASRAAK